MTTTYRVRLTRSAAKSLVRVDRRSATRLRAALRSLAIEPHPVGHKKLKGVEGYRIRVGDYRIVYTIDGDELVVEVIRIGHRRDVYAGR